MFHYGDGGMPARMPFAQAALLATPPNVKMWTPSMLRPGSWRCAAATSRTMASGGLRAKRAAASADHYLVNSTIVRERVRKAADGNHACPGNATSADAAGRWTGVTGNRVRRSRGTWGAISRPAAMSSSRAAMSA